jgi:hypothetical protein
MIPQPVICTNCGAWIRHEFRKNRGYDTHVNVRDCLEELKRRIEELEKRCG